MLMFFPGDVEEEASTQPEHIDIDSVDFDNELACADYVHSIMDHLFQSEVRLLTNPSSHRSVPQRLPSL